MEQRINPFETAHNAMKPLYGLGAYLAKSEVEKSLLHLIYFRVSQINGCAYCLDMHSKDLRAEGETEQRLYLLNAWREVPFYSDRERAALEWAEAVTEITNGNVSDEIYSKVRLHFTEQETIDLTMAVIAINSFNRLNISFRTPAGTYAVGEHAVQVK